MEENEKKKSTNGFLAILYALIQYAWAIVITMYFKHTGKLEYVTTPDGYIPLFFSNFLLAIPMGFVFVGSIARYRRNFEEKLDYVKTDRYALTLFLTTLYTVMLPLGAKLTTPATRGAYAWFYYLFFIAFFEEFLYRGLIPQLMEESNFPKVLVNTIPALLYGLYQTALPLARSSFNPSSPMESLPNIIISVASHYLLLAAKKWSGAMWLPIMLHATIEYTLYLILR